MSYRPRSYAPFTWLLLAALGLAFTLRRSDAGRGRGTTRNDDPPETSGMPSSEMQRTRQAPPAAGQRGSWFRMTLGGAAMTTFVCFLITMGYLRPAWQDPRVEPAGDSRLPALHSQVARGFEGLKSRGGEPPAETLDLGSFDLHDKRSASLLKNAWQLRHGSREDVETALVCLDRVIELEEDSPERTRAKLLLLRGQLLADMQRHLEAAVTLEGALELGSANYGLLAREYDRALLAGDLSAEEAAEIRSRRRQIEALRDGQAVAPAAFESRHEPTLPAPTAGVARNTTRALVVGVSDYVDWDFSRLDYAASDARRMARVLAGLDFDVEVLLDERATRDGVLDLLRIEADASRAGDRTVVYFAGHGFADPSGRQALVTGDGFALALEEMQAALDRHRGDAVVVLDNCFDTRELRSERFVVTGPPTDLTDGAGSVTFHLAGAVGKTAFESRRLQGGLFTHVVHEALAALPATGDSTWADLVTALDGVASSTHDLALRMYGVEQVPVVFASAPRRGLLEVAGAPFNPRSALGPGHPAGMSALAVGAVVNDVKE